MTDTNTVNREHLLNAVRSVAHICPNHATAIPSLTHVRLLDGRITATNLDQSISAPLDGAFPAVCVAGKKLLAVLSSLDGEEVDFGVRGSNLIIKCASSKFTLPTLPVEDHPGEIPVGEVAPVEFHGETFRKSLAHAGVACSEEESRYIMQGVCFGNGALAATDGRRLHFVAGAESFDNEVLPQRFVDAILRRDDNKIAYQCDGKVARVTFDDGTRLTTKLISGKFPDWKLVVPKKTTHPYVVPPTFSDVLRRAKLATDEKDVAVQIDFGSVIRVYVKDQFEETLPAREAPEATVTIAVNPEYLLDALTGDGEHCIYVKESEQPIIVEHGVFSAVVMPLRIA